MAKHPSHLNEVMTKEPVTVAPDLTLSEALDAMRSWGMRHLPVTEKGKVIGLLTERDIYKHLALGHTHKTEVREAMVINPFIVSGGETLAKVARAMADNKYGCTVVVNLKGEVSGIFTTTDALTILARLLDQSGESDFHVMSIEDYLNQYQAHAV